MENPFQQFFADRIDHFAAESMRLKTRQPLIEYKKLVDTFYFINKKLGTLEHEVVMAKVIEEFKLAAAESVDARRTIWRDFKLARARAVASEKSTAESDRRAAELLAGLEKSYAEMHEDDELRESMRSVLDAARRLTVPGNSLGRGWRKSAWLSLYVNLNAYTVYIRYAYARAMFFIFRHSFIFVTSILLFGVAYSEARNTGVDQLAAILPQWPWAVGALTVAAYLVKRYVIDPRIKKLQIKLEARRLRRLAFHLHIVRTMALVSRTVRRRHPSEA